MVLWYLQFLELCIPSTQSLTGRLIDAKVNLSAYLSFFAPAH